MLIVSIIQWSWTMGRRLDLADQLICVTGLQVQCSIFICLNSFVQTVLQYICFWKVMHTTGSFNVITRVIRTSIIRTPKILLYSCLTRTFCNTISMYFTCPKFSLMWTNLFFSCPKGFGEVRMHCSCEYIYRLFWFLDDLKDWSLEGYRVLKLRLYEPSKVIIFGIRIFF